MKMFGTANKVLAGVPVPGTPIVDRALDYARQRCEPYLHNHVVRSWLFAARLGQLQSITLISSVYPTQISAGGDNHDGAAEASANSAKIPLQPASVREFYARSPGRQATAQLTSRHLGVVRLLDQRAVHASGLKADVAFREHDRALRGGRSAGRAETGSKTSWHGMHPRCGSAWRDSRARVGNVCSLRARPARKPGAPWARNSERSSHAVDGLCRAFSQTSNRPSGLICDLAREFSNAPTVVEGLLQVFAHERSLNCKEVRH